MKQSTKGSAIKLESNAGRSRREALGLLGAGAVLLGIGTMSAFGTCGRRRERC